MTMLSDLERVVIVTGGAHGIGLGIVSAFADSGSDVWIGDIDDEGGEAASRMLQSRGLKVRAHRLDVSDPNSIAEFTDHVVAESGQVHVLVNNAAMFASVPMSREPFEQISIEEWDRMMVINLRGPWLVSRECLPIMRARNFGRIVNIGSAAVNKRVETRAHYVASKAGIVGLTRVMASELGRDGITVNCVAPGSVLSDPSAPPDLVRYQSEAATDRAIPRVETPADIAGVVLFLASHEASMVTGQTIIVDGGSVFL